MSKKKKTRRKIKKLAIHKCMGCGAIHSKEPGMQPACNLCGSLYFEWLNYEEFRIDV